METVTLPRRSAATSRSTWFVVGVTLVALILGWVLRTVVEDRVRLFEGGSISAELPADWVVQEGSGGLIMVAWDPESPFHRYSIGSVAARGVLEAADERNRQRAGLLTGYRLVEQSQESATLYRVGFAFVGDPDPSGIPTVVRGIDYYREQDDQVLIITLETTGPDFEGNLPAFHRFMMSVTTDGPG